MTTSRNQYATILSGDLDIEKDIWDVSQLDITKKREFSDSFDHGFADTRTYGNRKQAREKIKTYTKRGLFAGNDKSVRDILRDNKEHLSECIRTSEVSTTIGSRWIKMKLDDPRRKYEMYKTGFKWMDMGTSQPTGTGITNSSLGTQLAAGKRLFIQSEFDAFFPTAAAEPILDNWIKSGTNYYKPTNDGVSLTITDNNSDLTNLLKNKSGSYLENSNKAAYIQDKNVDIYNSDEFIIVDTTALSLTTTGWAYYDYYLHGDDVWILSRSKEEERQYIRDWEKNTRELRKRCIRIFESGSTPGHIWIKMKLDDVRRKEQHGGTEVSLDATTHKDLIAFLTTNKGPIITGETGYVLDSIINPETNNIITYGTEYVLDTLPDMPQVNYYDYYQPSLNGDVWVVSKSREEERKYMRDWETNSRELRKRCIRKRESGALASVKGHIWIKMKSDDPRRKEYHGDVQKITHNDTTHADLVSFLKETPTGISGTTGYVVDSIINPDTHKIMTYGTEYVFDTLPTTMPTINNYYDWYEPTGWQSGDYIWVVSKSTEQERAYMRDWETNSRELRKRCIRKRERGALASVKGHIWIKMKSDDPRRKEYHGGQKITHNDTTHADLVSFLKETPTGISGTTGYVVDSIINPDTHKIMTYGTEYVFDTLPTTMPTINNYYDWYEPTGWQSGDYIWVVSKSREEDRVDIRTIESVTETERNLYRNREASDVIQGGLREWQEDANRIGRRWTVRTWPPPLSSSELSNISNQQFLASLNLKQSNQSLTDGDFIDLTKSEFNTYDLDAVFTELYKMGRRWIVKNTQPTIGTQLDSSTTHSVLLGHLNSEGALLPEDTKISLSSHEFNNIYNLNLVNFDIQFGTWIGDGGGKYYVASRGGDAWIGPTTQGSYYFEATEGTQTNYTDYINFPGNDGGTDVHPS